MIRERPILYSGPMVRALRAGKKTQTRRVVPLQPKAKTAWCGSDGMWRWGHIGQFPGNDDYEIGQRCKFGEPGDRLWVRETFTRNGFKIGEKVFYRADGESQFIGEMRESNGNITRYHTDHWEKNGEKRKGSDWKPSIHMPRWACRVVLGITEVRVQRIQEISDEDIIAEGIEEYAAALNLGGSLRSQWVHLWEKINGKRENGRFGWDQNPWVYAITFKVIEGLTTP